MLQYRVVISQSWAGPQPSENFPFMSTFLVKNGLTLLYLTLSSGFFCPKYNDSYFTLSYFKNGMLTGYTINRLDGMKTSTFNIQYGSSIIRNSFISDHSWNYGYILNTESDGTGISGIL